MPKAKPTPSSVIISLMGDYGLNPYSLSKAIGLSPSVVRLLVIGKSKVTVPTALRLAKLFGQTPSYWLDLQKEADLIEAGKDKRLAKILKGITKAVKPKALPKKIKKAPKKLIRKSTLRDKRAKPAKKAGRKSLIRRRKTGR